MKTAVIAVSALGAELAETLIAALPDAEAHVYAPYALAGQRSFQALHDVIKELWDAYEGLIFLCASGIAVRAIAPYVSSKYVDPAVVICGDAGAFAVSLLSGHEGGANGLAMEAAACIGAVPVITTASELSPRILPRNLVAGMGCRKGASIETIRHAVDQVFAEHRLSLLRVRSICTIDLKQAEPGLLAFAEALGAPIVTFTAEELNAVPGSFTVSDYVKEVTGTDNVCERAAVAGGIAAGGIAAGGIANGGKGRLVVQKTALDGVTVAVFEKEIV
jgi:cobalt-precorrin 5A hydrolase